MSSERNDDTLVQSKQWSATSTGNKPISAVEMPVFSVPTGTPASEAETFLPELSETPEPTETVPRVLDVEPSSELLELRTAELSPLDDLSPLDELVEDPDTEKTSPSADSLFKPGARKAWTSKT